MTSQGSQYPYSIRETEQFGNDWRRAVRLGYLNPMADPATLTYIKEKVAEDPYQVHQMSNDVPSNRRRLRLSRRVHIWYSIIEDDRTVWLESVRIIGED